ncbi:SDR family NAD(P)-dependent oxidoreductase [Thermoactinomyces sp. CICC 10522]|uniref:SDR family NAD(P)-dependent oxidoreductase n=1 Tax=Thermoactinomyces sp. CICC 10522 TaxID=2767427 RepID=UPI00351C2968
MAEVHVGEGQVLARLHLPSAAAEAGKGFHLHPGMVDAAIQAGLGLGIDSGRLEPALPFAVEEVEIYGKTGPAMWARVHQETGGKLSVDLCDETGRICLRMHDLVTRMAKPDTASIGATAEEHTGNLLLKPVWEVIPQTMEEKFPLPGQNIVLAGGTEAEREAVARQYPGVRVLEIDDGDSIEVISGKIRQLGHVDHLIWIAPDGSVRSMTEERLIEAQEQMVIKLFRLTKAFLHLGYGQKELGWTLITTQAQQIHPDEKIQPAQSALHGFAGSLAKEYPHWPIRLIDLEKTEDIRWAFARIRHLQGEVLACRGGEWYRQQLLQVKDVQKQQVPYRTGGVYVVIGGAGGIGEVWSEYLIRNYRAKIVWIGRREKNREIADKIDRLCAYGPAPLYISADATDRRALERAHREIREKVGPVRGVVHSAIVLLDQSIEHMDEVRFRASLEAKVNVSVRLAQVFASEPLDFVLFFSSVQSFAKAAGQSNYAAGSTFEDAFALALAREWTCPVKVMNWGYWGSVGVVAAKEYHRRMAEAGIGSVEAPEAMEALEILLSNPVSQLAFINTIRPLTEQEMNPSQKISVYPATIRSYLDLLVKERPREDQRMDQVMAAIANKMEQLTSLLIKLLWSQLQSTGLFREQSGNLTRLRKSLHKGYGRWLAETAAILEQHHYLKRDGQNYTLLETAPVDAEAVWREWDARRQEWIEDENIRPHLSLAEAVLRELPAILTGKKAATEILFPDSSMERVEGIYKQNAVADYYNEKLAAMVAAYLEQRKLREPGVTVRILEIGAGTGGASSAVLKKLKPFREQIKEYCYTDISRAFLLFAEKEFGSRNPNLTCKLFDVTEPVAGQGIEAGGYDIVIASNVLHATRDLRETLRNAKAALKRNGLLLLNETTSKTLLNHLTFGLLEGWWLFEDEALRIPGSPLLTAEQWQTVLRYEGFRPALAPVFPNGPQHLILAESNGVVRQRVRENHQSLLPETEISEIMPAPVASENAETDEDAVRSGITVYLKKIVGGILKLPIEQIDSAEPLERYGFDSILATQMTNALRNVFEQISGTLLFECQTLDEVADFLLKTQPETVKTLVAGSGGEKRDGAAHAQVNAAGRTPDQTDVKRTRRLRFPRRKSDRNSRTLIDVAIIGVAGRFPKANDLHEYWELLKSGQSGITEIPKKRWDWREYYDAEPGKPGHIYSKWGGFLDGIDQFDPYFFRISPAEAKRMDPQERLFLEIAYQSIADAGYTPENLSHSRRVGVFVGVMNGHYPPGASYWSIANRVSYTLNFQGPSLAVDSACSSSLTAIHLALESIYSGVSECAIAGGVNLIVHPDHYRKLSAMMMLSPGDKCRPFGKQADGIVDGEGVGAVVLKPLSQAEADGDHIYGVIKGSMLNAGGKTNGYTVPNPRQQEQVIAEALQRTGIDARTISYIEAHGTGTALGDPIEIKGLTAAFERHTSDRQFCAIGSVKSNIGHTESAAGIAGLIKVLLQLKHRQLVPSLHAGEPNVNIDFRNTPFVVQQELGEWRRPAIERDGKIREYPRRAGISSFGAGGANAHLVVEEYIPKKRKRSGSPITDNRPALIVLSAKREEALRQQANRLLAAIEREQFTSGELACIAYTLQTGREAMAERLAFTAASIAELKHQLRTFLGRADQPGDGLLRGRVKARSEGPAVSAERIRQWIRAGKFRPLLEAWVNGADVDWNQLYETDKPSRIPLPADPFVRESFWITEHKPGVPAQVQVPSAHLHPLLHQNVSDLDGLKFATNFDGREFFLRDHVVRGKRVLPGMVYLEMARAAAMAVSSRTESGERATALRLKNVSWNRPLVLDAPTVRVHIGLFPGNNGEITYEIYKQPENGDADPTVYCQGRIVPAKAGDQTPQLDLPALRALCGKRMLTPAACYAAFQSLGIVYGPGYQGLEEIYAGQGQVLAKISLPDSVADTADQYHLHPSLIDAAVQSSLGLVSAEDRTVLFLPFALDELEIYGNCTPRMWALVRRRPKETANANLQKLDIDFCDEQGSLRLRMKGLTMKAVQSTERFQGADSGQSPLLLSPYWKAEKAVGRPDLSSAHEQRHVIVCGADEKLAQEMEHRLPGVHFHYPTIREDGIDGKFADVALEVFAVIQRILKAKPTGTVSVQVLLLNRKEYPFAGAICAMLQTARLENPRVTGQCLELEGNGGIDNILGILEENRLENRVLRVAYQDGERCVPDWREVPYAREPAAVPWKEGGVYFITGGAGGLASIFAREIARHINRGTLILAGRSQPDAARHAAFRELEKDGFRVVYRQLDVTDRDKVVRCLEDIREEYGGLDGIIHAAGVTSDQFIIQKTPSQFARVLAPKVTGLVNLDEASREDDLDFFVIFSSLAGVTGNIGQADYAAANAFADQYAQYRHHLVALDQRRGRTLSINWPLWEDGGMRIESEQEARWMQDIGMSALKSEAGIKAFYQALASGHPQVLVLHGDQNKLKRFIGAGKQQADEAERRESPPVSYEFCLSLTEKIARNELSEEQFMQLLQSQRSQIETWGKR